MCANQMVVNANACGCVNRVAIKTTTDAGHGDKSPGNKRIDVGACHGCDDEVVGINESTPITVCFEGKMVNFEKDYALKVEERVDYWLYIYGIDNQRTRCDDYTRKFNKKKNKVEEAVNWRWEKANKNDSAVLVSIHLDKGGDDGYFLVYRDKPNEGESNYNKQLCQSEEGKKLGYMIAECIKVLCKNSKLKEVVVPDHSKYCPPELGVLRYFNGKAAILIELCGIKNVSSQQLISNSANEIGKGIATGVYKYLFGKDAEPQERRKEILIDEDFSSDAWALNKRWRDCDATWQTVINEETAVRIVTSLANADDIQLVRSKIPIEEEGCYRLTFEARVDSAPSADGEARNELMFAEALVEGTVSRWWPRDPEMISCEKYSIGLAASWERYAMIISATGKDAITARLVLNIGTLPQSTVVMVRNVRLFSGDDNIAVVPPTPPTITVKGRTLSVSSPSKIAKWTIRVVNSEGETARKFEATSGDRFSLTGKTIPAGKYTVEVIGWHDHSVQIELK